MRPMFNELAQLADEDHAPIWLCVFCLSVGIGVPSRTCPTCDRELATMDQLLAAADLAQSIASERRTSLTLELTVRAVHTTPTSERIELVSSDRAECFVALDLGSTEAPACGTKVSATFSWTERGDD